MAAVLAAAPSPLREAVGRHDGVAASHAWAAKLHGADRVFVPESPEVTVAAPHTLAIVGVTVRRTRSLEPCDITMVDGIPVTSGARTTIDLADRLDEAVVTGFGLPPPAYNVPLYDRRGRIGIADVCWEGRVTVVVELDGLRFHLLSRQRAMDTVKHNRYATSGRIPLRFGYEDVVRDPGGVAGVIRSALGLAQAGETGRCVG